MPTNYILGIIVLVSTVLLFSWIAIKTGHDNLTEDFK